jgi:hypothetical protein
MEARQAAMLILPRADLREACYMVSRLKKATFSLHQEVLEALSGAVAQGQASSKNALVERALVRELRALREQALAAEWDLAAKDPLFLKDIEEIEADFAWADAETAARIG